MKNVLELDYKLCNAKNNDLNYLYSLGLPGSDNGWLPRESMIKCVWNEERDIVFYNIKTATWFELGDVRICGVYIKGYIVKCHAMIRVNNSTVEDSNQAWWEITEMTVPGGLINLGYNEKEIAELVIKLMDIYGIARPELLGITALTPKCETQIIVTDEEVHEPLYTVDDIINPRFVTIQGVKNKFMLEASYGEDEKFIENTLLKDFRVHPSTSMWLASEKKDIFLYTAGGYVRGGVKEESDKYLGLYIKGYNIVINVFYDNHFDYEALIIDKYVKSVQVPRGLLKIGFDKETVETVLCDMLNAAQNVDKYPEFKKEFEICQYSWVEGRYYGNDEIAEHHSKVNYDIKAVHNNNMQMNIKAEFEPKNVQYKKSKSKNKKPTKIKVSKEAKLLIFLTGAVGGAYTYIKLERLDITIFITVLSWIWIYFTHIGHLKRSMVFDDLRRNIKKK